MSRSPMKTPGPRASAPTTKKAASAKGAPAKRAAPKKKSSTLVVLSTTPGLCGGCRHANHGTTDFAEGHVACWMDRRSKRADQRCDATTIAPRTPGSAPSTWKTYFFYERFTGTNGTHRTAEDLRLLAPDADEAQRALQHADLPLIP